MSTEAEALQARWATLNEELVTQEFREQLCKGLRELKDSRAYEFADAADKVRKLRAKLSQVEDNLRLQDAITIAKDYVAVHELEVQIPRSRATSAINYPAAGADATASVDPAQDLIDQKSAILEKHGKFGRIITVNP